MRYLNSKTGAASLSILSNTVLVISKVTVGISIGSVSVISEGIHSAVDLLAAVMAFLAVRVSGRPPDKRHPYGHGKWENVAGTIEALLILVAAGLIIYEAGKRITEHLPPESVDLGIALMAFSAVVNFFVSRHLMSVAKRTESVALEADALHLTTDVYTSLGVFAGLIVVKVTGIWLLDPMIAIAVALFIVRAAVDLTRRSFSDLLDVRLPAHEESAIATVLADHAEAFRGFHKLRSRRSGAGRHIDFHLVVDPDITVADAHALADHLEDEIRSCFPECSVMTHLEPADLERTERARPE